MKAFFKTLFGDTQNIATVAVIMGVEVLLVRTGNLAVAVYAVPVATLLGVIWLAPR